MNNFELECFALVKDILMNRPKDIRGKTIKYCSEDRTKILKILAEQKENIDENMDKMPFDSYRLLCKIIEDVRAIVEEKMI